MPKSAARKAAGMVEFDSMRLHDFHQAATAAAKAEECGKQQQVWLKLKLLSH